ncbi:hypothetical protein Vretimale_15898 [Volvox reticuliferus]|uniref:ABC1 atypical kinase-like domain-containing protein n=1 Tax=Volvox reticuliferus TaxID=1737510 RepID=A0A8J4FU67_9CHLO|nr:hypothetical protein Vretifemale_12968 [Volvox reticuliferus]GIM12724.1 hypothetical protein Vretimale_15898 [Volvox reticuliferus]
MAQIEHLKGGHPGPTSDSRFQSRRVAAFSTVQPRARRPRAAIGSHIQGGRLADGASLVFPMASKPTWPWRSGRRRPGNFIIQARYSSGVSINATGSAGSASTTTPLSTTLPPGLSDNPGPSNRALASTDTNLATSSYDSGSPMRSLNGGRPPGMDGRVLVSSTSTSTSTANSTRWGSGTNLSYSLGTGSTEAHSNSANSRASAPGAGAGALRANTTASNPLALRSTSKLRATATAGGTTIKATAAGRTLPETNSSQREAAAAAADGSDIDIPEFMEPSTYDAAMNSRYWETRPVRVLSRLLRIGFEFGGWAAAARARNLRIKDPAAQEAAAAESLKDVLVRLGPAFVKIGQALSSRPDVLPPSYIAALEALQDRIPPFPDSAAMAVLESELGGPPSAIFSSLSASPVAAASLGQVYRGSLRPELGGGEVAVKVQRPRVAQMIAQDVYILRILAGWLRKARRLNTDLPALVDEWASSLFRELNYRTEAANARRFKELFSHLPQVYVPYIYDEYTTAKILTMEWIEGERLRTAGSSISERDPASSKVSATRSDSSGSSRGNVGPLTDPQRLEDLALVEVGVRCSLEQMLEEGFYHADPHPGNLLRTPDGRLAYLDFGMMGQIDERTRNALMTATLHLVNREYGRLAEDFITLGLLPPGTDRDAVLPALTGVFTEALKGGVSNLSFGQLSGNLGMTMYKYSFRIPPYYTLLVRSLSVLEGIALAADPNYKVLGSAYPWIARRLLTDPSTDLRTALRRLLYSAEGQFRFDRLESLLRQAAKSANRLKRPSQLQGGPPTATALTSVDGGAALPTASTASTSATGSTAGIGVVGVKGGSGGGGALLLLLSRDGEFVRGILLDEVAKGIDGAWRIAADATVATVRQGVAGLPTPALPLLALLPGAPLLAMLAAGRSDASSNRNSSSGTMSVQQSLSAALAQLPALATADDRAQVEGLLQLGNALADVSGLKLPASSSSSGVSSSGTAASASAGPRPPSYDPADLYGAVSQASEAVLWLAREAMELPDEAKGELLQLPLQLGARVASRVTARALRTLVLGKRGEEGGSGDSGEPGAEVVPPAGP